MTWCCGQCYHCTEEPLLLSEHAALMSLWELCHPSLGRILCIQPGTLRQHMPRGPMIWGSGATGLGLETAPGAPVLPQPNNNPLVPGPQSLPVLTSTVNCPRPQFLPSATLRC